MTTNEPQTSSPPAAPAAMRSTSGGWRDMRGTLLAVGVLLVASAVAVVIAYALKGSGAPAGDVQASTVEYEVRMPTMLSAGKHTVGVTNDGTLAHEFVIFKTDLPADQLPLGADGDVDEDSPQLTNVADSGASIAPGASRSVTTAKLAPGHYVALCNLPGHYQLGMHLDVTVS